ncbi:bolA-like protein 3 [Condylostylus longicornis]|uniref:bolA-like protein 3 n=1 Tax=Condylostylus longicornis TaxID=2530218 RepID=UPI00244DBE1A|nr:bolA-like protein 3 [Condylostylus longicornis]
MSRLFSFLKNSKKFLVVPRLFAQTNGSEVSESNLVSILKNKFPKANVVEVEDISGGCGAMFKIFVETSEFEGNTVIKQHKMITEALKDQIKDMHGLTIQTSIPKVK